MKNYEKYADEIKALDDGSSCYEKSYCIDFIIPNVLHPLGKKCAGMNCQLCSILTTMWLLEDYKEPEVDWGKVEVDTPILVKEFEDEAWGRRHFARYENGIVYVWNCGHTSWTAFDNSDVTVWKYAKLAESEEE